MFGCINCLTHRLDPSLLETLEKDVPERFLLQKERPDAEEIERVFRPGRKPMRVLVLADDLQKEFRLVRLLLQLGHRVFLADTEISGKKAVLREDFWEHPLSVQYHRARQAGRDQRSLLLEIEDFIARQGDGAAPEPSSGTNAVPESSAPAGVSASLVQHLKAKTLLQLKPCSKWCVVIDETGDFYWDPRYPEQKTTGAIVALLIPWNSKLLPLPDFHSVENKPRRVLKNFLRLLRYPIGILVVDVNSIPGKLRKKKMLYEYTLMSVLELIARFVPCEKKVRLNVYFENRGSMRRGSVWKPVEVSLLQRLSWTMPERARRMSLEIETVAKGEHPWLAYADVVGYVLFSRKPEFADYQEILRPFLCSGEEITQYVHGWDLLAVDRMPEPSLWREWVGREGADDGNTLAGRLLQDLMGNCRKSPEAWQVYFEETRRHLESKSVNLMRLGREISWLRACAPGALSLKMELAFRTAQLAQSNHLGCSYLEDLNAIRKLSSQLTEEDPGLCCWADLHLAVNRIDQYDFLAAADILSPWMFSEPVVPGLQMWGRARSLMGQIYAFSGAGGQAVRLFDEALSAFAHLSEPDVARGERLQTGVYRAIAMMDDPRARRDRAEAALEAIMGDLPQAVGRLAKSMDDSEKYLHHTLLRFLALHPAGNWRAAYLEQREAWQTGIGHPWQWIEAYRALLLHFAGKTDAAREHAQKAMQIATQGGQGAILHWMALVMQRLFEAQGIQVEAWNLMPREQILQQIPRLSSRMSALDSISFRHVSRALKYLVPFNHH